MQNLTIPAMELDDLKNIWLKEKEELESRIALNENLVREMSLDKSKNSFDKLIKIAIIKSYFTFTLMMISIIIASMRFNTLEFSIMYIGGIAMMFSFFQQISFTKPDLTNMSTIELQKAVCQFRIYALKCSKYDAPLGILWFLSMMPVHFKVIISPLFSIIVLLALALGILSSPIASRQTYKKQDNQLKEIEEQLNQILEFEKK